MEYDRETLDKYTEGPLLETIEFTLAIATSFNRGPARVTEVSVQPLFAQHGDECSQQRHQQTCIQEVQGCDDLLRGATPGWGSGRGFFRENRPVKGEENRAEVDFRPFIGVWLEL